MAELTGAILTVRKSVAAILRIHLKRPEMTKKGKKHPAQFDLAFGTGFCVVTDRYLVTAFHVLNNGQPRDVNDRFYAITVPDNGEPAYHFPVCGFPLERPDLDLAVLEIGPCATTGIHIPSVPVSFGSNQDGTRVLTVGYPAPEIHSVNLDHEGTFHGGEFFLKSHANMGIISAQYAMGDIPVYELSVGWHHGESGGPIVSLDDATAVFSVMQQYRNIQSPHGTVAGPHRGVALSRIRDELVGLGVTVI